MVKYFVLFQYTPATASVRSNLLTEKMVRWSARFSRFSETVTSRPDTLCAGISTQVVDLMSMIGAPYSPAKNSCTLLGLSK